MASRVEEYRGCDHFEIPIEDPAYPESLRELSDPPECLYGIGNRELIESPSLAVIGSRRATPYGLAVASLAGRIAGEAGITVVSGGAIGCDQAAGRAALKAGGNHVVVLGTGADVVYPAQGADMFGLVASGRGALLSIAPWGTQPLRFLFPKRNRVIAALSRCLFISEAGVPSGTFSTAETALELGRELICAPGSIFSPQSRATNQLISEGAGCIVDEDSLEVAISRIFNTLRFSAGAREGLPPLSRDEQKIIAALTSSPERIDAIAHMLGVGIVAALERMGALEGDGLVTRLPDGRYATSEHALHCMTTFGQNGW